MIELNRSIKSMLMPIIRVGLLSTDTSKCNNKLEICIWLDSRDKLIR